MRKRNVSSFVFSKSKPVLFRGRRGWSSSTILDLLLGRVRVALSLKAAEVNSAPRALFEDKPHSANDAWRKLHFDPLLLIRQCEQEALARIKNNPVQMALIRKSIEKKLKEKSLNRKERHKKHHHSGSKHRKHSSSKHKLYSEDDASEDDKISRNHHHKRSEYGNHSRRRESDSKDELKETKRLEKNHRKQKYGYYDEDVVKRNHDKSKHDKYTSQATHSIDADKNQDKDGRSYYDNRAAAPQDDKLRKGTSKLSEEERAVRLCEMQEDTEVHEEKRWKRLKKAYENDAQEAKMASMSVGQNSLDYARTHLANYAKDYVHIHIQLRNDRKSLTTVQRLKKEFIYSKILKIPSPIVAYFLSFVPF
ncbi:hypothetical protein PTKIN_Ptkin02bG0101400 [Pterospermum kingtungense]